MTTIKSIAFTVSATGLVAGAASIAQVTSGGSHAEAAPANTPVIRSAADMTYPLEKYGIPDTKMPLIYHARRVFDERCMKRLGFDPAQSPHINDNVAPGAGSQLLSYLDVTTARRYGYHAVNPVSPKVASPGDTPRSISKNLESLEEAAYTGKDSSGAIVKAVNGQPVPRGGCSGESLAKLTQGAEKLPVDPRYLNLLAEEATAKDPRMRLAIKSWSECMRGAGYSYDMPWEAVAAGQRTAQPTTQEKDMASTDVSCRQKSNLLGMWVDVERAYQEQLISEHTADLARAKQVLAIWLNNAQKVS